MKNETELAIKMARIANNVITSNYFLSAINDGKEADKQRFGGYFGLYIDAHPQCRMPPLLTLALGDFSEEKAAIYYRHMEEKALRLQDQNPEKYVSSWQTRDRDNRKYGGAIRAGRYILSSTGTTELAEEAFCLFVAFMAGIIDEDSVRNIAEISGCYGLVKIVADKYQTLEEVSQIG